MKQVQTSIVCDFCHDTLDIAVCTKCGKDICKKHTIARCGSILYEFCDSKHQPAMWCYSCSRATPPERFIEFNNINKSFTLKLKLELASYWVLQYKTLPYESHPFCYILQNKNIYGYVHVIDSIEISAQEILDCIIEELERFPEFSSTESVREIMEYVCRKYRENAKEIRIRRRNMPFQSSQHYCTESRLWGVVNVNNVCIDKDGKLFLTW